MTLEEATSVMREEKNQELREQAQQALVQMASFEQSAFVSFLQAHSGQRGLHSGGDVHGDPGNLFYGCEANKNLLFARAKKLSDTGEVTPGSLERAFAELRAEDSLAPIPEASNPTNKDGGEHLREAGQRTLYPDQKHEMARARFDEATRPIVPYTKQQLLEWGGQVRGVPASIGKLKAAVARYGSPAINAILQAD